MPSRRQSRTGLDLVTQARQEECLEYRGVDRLRPGGDTGRWLNQSF